MPYASVEQLRAYLEQVPAGASEDTLLGRTVALSRLGTSSEPDDTLRSP